MAEPVVLTPADLGILNKVLQGCSDWGCVVAKLKATGLPVEDLEAELQRQQTVASGLKAAFFPSEH